jgi:hypothetical protein
MIVDDHDMVRTAVSQAIEGPDLTVAAEAGTVAEALELALGSTMRGSSGRCLWHVPLPTELAAVEGGTTGSRSPLLSSGRPALDQSLA